MDIAEALRELADKIEQSNRGSGLPAYRLNKAVPGLPAGVIFVHDENDSVKGSIGYGCLKLAWDYGNCQGKTNEYMWCGGTHVFPGQLAEDREWFTPVRNDGRYT